MSFYSQLIIYSSGFLCYLQNILLAFLSNIHLLRSDSDMYVDKEI